MADRSYCEVCDRYVGGGVGHDELRHGRETERLVYLAGPYTHAGAVTRNEWRAEVADRAPFETVNPSKKYSPEWPSEELVERCFMDIALSDGVLVGDTGQRSPGTWREVQYARDSGIPVVVWDIDSPREDFVDVLSVVQTCAEAIAATVSAIEDSND